MDANLNYLEDHFIQDLKGLVCLDYAAVEAYEAAIEKLKNEKYKNTLEKFKYNHETHIRNISLFLKEKGYNCPTGPGVKLLLSQGKVILATFAGDVAILKALRRNEVTTSDAYESINTYDGIPSNLKKVLLDGYEDEKDHLFWIEEELDEIS
jgi:rubrerythrin